MPVRRRSRSNAHYRQPGLVEPTPAFCRSLRNGPANRSFRLPVVAPSRPSQAWWDEGVRTRGEPDPVRPKRLERARIRKKPHTSIVILVPSHGNPRGRAGVLTPAVRPSVRARSCEWGRHVSLEVRPTPARCRRVRPGDAQGRRANPSRFGSRRRRVGASKADPGGESATPSRNSFPPIERKRHSRLGGCRRSGRRLRDHTVPELGHDHGSQGLPQPQPPERAAECPSHPSGRGWRLPCGGSGDRRIPSRSALDGPRLGAVQRRGVGALGRRRQLLAFGAELLGRGVRSPHLLCAAVRGVRGRSGNEHQPSRVSRHCLPGEFDGPLPRAPRQRGPRGVQPRRANLGGVAGNHGSLPPQGASGGGGRQHVRQGIHRRIGRVKLLDE